MTIDEYYAALRQLGLRPDKVLKTIWRDREGDPHYVRDPANYSFEERAILVDEIRASMQLPD
jgi:hypothetical protein